MSDRQNHGNTVLLVSRHFLEVFLLSNYGISHTQYTLYITVFIREKHTTDCVYMCHLTKLEVYQLSRMSLKSNMAVPLCFQPNTSLSHTSTCVLPNKIALTRSLPYCRMWTMQANIWVPSSSHNNRTWKCDFQKQYPCSFLLVELMKNQSRDNSCMMENTEVLGAVHS